VHRDIGRPLGVHHLVGVVVPVVLIGDVHVGTGVHVVADLEIEMTDDVAAASDHAPVTDTHHRIGDHALPRHHARRNAHMGTDQRVATDPDPLFPEDGPGRKGQAAAVAERTEPVGQHLAGTDGSLVGQPVPADVDGGIEPASVDGPVHGRAHRRAHLGASRSGPLTAPGALAPRAVFVRS
jgi:hypothetical protein